MRKHCDEAGFGADDVGEEVKEAKQEANCLGGWFLEGGTCYFVGFSGV